MLLESRASVQLLLLGNSPGLTPMAGGFIMAKAAPAHVTTLPLVTFITSAMGGMRSLGRTVH